MAYDFTVDWFSRHIPVWDQLIAQKSPRRIVEIGSFEGRSACYFVERCAAHGPLELWCVDTWEGGEEHLANSRPGEAERRMKDVEARFDRNIAEARAGAAFPVTFHKMKSRSNIALAELLAADKQPTMDLVYVDGSHQAPDVLSDATLAFSLLKVGGLLIFDDYLWFRSDPLNKNPFSMPKPAIDAFLNIFMCKLNIIRGAPLHQIYVEKIAE